MLYNTGDSQHTQNIQIIKLLVKMKYVSFILWKKLNRVFDQPNVLFSVKFKFQINKTYCLSKIKI